MSHAPSDVWRHFTQANDDNVEISNVPMESFWKFTGDFPPFCNPGCDVNLKTCRADIILPAGRFFFSKSIFEIPLSLISSSCWSNSIFPGSASDPEQEITTKKPHKICNITAWSTFAYSICSVHSVLSLVVVSLMCVCSHWRAPAMGNSSGMFREYRHPWALWRCNDMRWYYTRPDSWSTLCTGTLQKHWTVLKRFMFKCTAL